MRISKTLVSVLVSIVARCRQVANGCHLILTRCNARQQGISGTKLHRDPATDTPFSGVSQQRQLPFFQGHEEDEEDEGLGRGVDWRVIMPHELQHGVRCAPAQNALSFVTPAPHLPSIAPPASHATSLAPSASHATPVQPTPSQDLYSSMNSTAMQPVVLLKRTKLLRMPMENGNLRMKIKKQKWPNSTKHLP
ncbi:hypothetical protein K488DRAFT_73973 [Vararia minispora EC-137]|uniref:Uncharacterized protein n=1 Tax=Vararia minispora EC-137 TaxID=1314806 RepID=A0ACB8Q8Q5_9AGAM|nr:hypothetical protein K488DRAFT_73973 [Vararia minispora EC-137]